VCIGSVLCEISAGRRSSEQHQRCRRRTEMQFEKNRTVRYEIRANQCR